MLLELLATVAPVFVITGVGYAWARLGRRFDVETIGSLVLYVGTPCLIYSTLTALEVDVSSFGRMAVAAVIGLIVAAALSMIVLRIAALPFRTFLPALIHPNSGNMGIPIVFLAFGDEGLALAVSYFFVVALSQYTIGFAIASGSVEPRQIAQQPLIWAVLLSLVTMATGLTPPEWVEKTTALLGGLTIPLMLILLGVSLATLRASDVGPSLGLALARLVIGVAAALAAILLLGLTGAERGPVFLLAVMPAAIFSIVFAQRFDRQPDKVASLIFVSTLLTLALMPALVWIALRLAAP